MKPAAIPDGRRSFSVEEACRIPALAERLDEVQKEYEKLDLTWLFRLGEKIDEKVYDEMYAKKEIAHNLKGTKEQIIAD